MHTTDLKIRAKINLNGRMMHAVLLWLFSLFPTCIQWCLSILIYQKMPVSFLSVGFETLLLVLTSVLTAALRQAMIAWSEACACEENPAKRLAFYWLRPSGAIRALAVRTRLFFYRMGWTFLLLSPGVILFGTVIKALSDGSTFDLLMVSCVIGSVLCLLCGFAFLAVILQKYALVRFLAALDPDKKISCLIKESEVLTDGKCLYCLRYKLSFVPWVLPGILIVPLFYSVPYYRQFKACLYSELCGIKKDERI